MSALEQAVFLERLAAHLRRHPHLPPVIVHRDDLQLDFGFEAEGALLWAKTLGDPQLELTHFSAEKATAARAWTRVSVTGRLDGVLLRVWSSDYGDLWRWADPAGEWTPITLAQLADYVARGTTGEA